MGKRIRKSDDFYQEALIWMGYRYAIGITEYVGRSGQSEAERYRMFRDIEFDTEEFHALAGAFMDFLKRKKITDIVQLRDRYRENDLVWLSRNYAMGRHSYAASHCEDIISYSDEVLSPERKEFMAHDIRRELGDHLRFKSFFFDLPMGIERTHSPLDLFLRFITENEVDTEEKLLEYNHIQVTVSPEGEVSYWTEKKDKVDKEKDYFSACGLLMTISGGMSWLRISCRRVTRSVGLFTMVRSRLFRILIRGRGFGTVAARCGMRG